MRMPYSLYKKSYSEFPAENYDKAKKTIDVQLPADYKRPRFPKDWERRCDGFFVDGIHIYQWNSGYAEQFLVAYGNEEHTFAAGLKTREQVIEMVNSILEGRA